MCCFGSCPETTRVFMYHSKRVDKHVQGSLWSWESSCGSQRTDSSSTRSLWHHHGMFWEVGRPACASVAFLRILFIISHLRLKSPPGHFVPWNFCRCHKCKNKCKHFHHRFSLITFLCVFLRCWYRLNEHGCTFSVWTGQGLIKRKVYFSHLPVLIDCILVYFLTPESLASHPLIHIPCYLRWRLHAWSEWWTECSAWLEYLGRYIWLGEKEWRSVLGRWLVVAVHLSWWVSSSAHVLLAPEPSPGPGSDGKGRWWRTER